MRAIEQCVAEEADCTQGKMCSHREGDFLRFYNQTRLLSMYL
jgi:hypothetical protein